MFSLEASQGCGRRKFIFYSTISDLFAFVYMKNITRFLVQRSISFSRQKGRKEGRGHWSWGVWEVLQGAKEHSK